MARWKVVRPARAKVLKFKRRHSTEACAVEEAVVAVLDAFDQVVDAGVQDQEVRGKRVLLVTLHKTSYALSALYSRKFLRIRGNHIPKSDELKDGAVSVNHVLVLVRIQV